MIQHTDNATIIRAGKWKDRLVEANQDLSKYVIERLGHAPGSEIHKAWSLVINEKKRQIRNMQSKDTIYQTHAIVRYHQSDRIVSVSFKGATHGYPVDQLLGGADMRQVGDREAVARYAIDTFNQNTGLGAK